MGNLEQYRLTKKNLEKLHARSDIDTHTLSLSLSFLSSTPIFEQLIPPYEYKKDKQKIFKKEKVSEIFQGKNENQESSTD